MTRDRELQEPRRRGGRLWLRIVLKFTLTIVLVWAMSEYMDQYFFLTGGIAAYVIVAALLTLMNMIVRPLLKLLTLPLRLLGMILAVIIVNGVFVWLTEWIVSKMEPDLVTLDIQGGIGGWIVVAIVLGLGNWVLRLILR